MRAQFARDSDGLTNGRLVYGATASRLRLPLAYFRESSRLAADGLFPVQAQVRAVATDRRSSPGPPSRLSSPSSRIRLSLPSPPTSVSSPPPPTSSSSLSSPVIVSLPFEPRTPSIPLQNPWPGVVRPAPTIGRIGHSHGGAAFGSGIDPRDVWGRGRATSPEGADGVGMERDRFCGRRRRPI